MKIDLRQFNKHLISDIKALLNDIRKGAIKLLIIGRDNKPLDAVEEKGLESLVISAAASKGLTLTPEQVQPYTQGVVNAFDQLDDFLIHLMETKSEKAADNK